MRYSTVKFLAFFFFITTLILGSLLWFTVGATIPEAARRDESLLDVSRNFVRVQLRVLGEAERYERLIDLTTSAARENLEKIAEEPASRQPVELISQDYTLVISHETAAIVYSSYEYTVNTVEFSRRELHLLTFTEGKWLIAQVIDLTPASSANNPLNPNDPLAPRGPDGQVIDPNESSEPLPSDFPSFDPFPSEEPEPDE